MTDRIDKLRTLLRLRHREVERRVRDATEAARAVVRAEADRERADAALMQAEVRHANALTSRLEAPCDTLVDVFCQRTEAALETTRERVKATIETLQQAHRAASEGRRRLIRAQARSDALEAFLARALKHHRRATDRRLADELASDRRPANAVAFA